jgi:hypothetical protein
VTDKDRAEGSIEGKATVDARAGLKETPMGTLATTAATTRQADETREAIKSVRRSKMQQRKRSKSEADEMQRCIK